MAVERPLETPEIEAPTALPIEVEIVPDDELEGDIDVQFGEDDETSEETPFAANLAEEMDENELNKLAQELCRLFEADKRTRAGWEKTYEQGIKLLGLSEEKRSDPWPEACGVFHPVLTEAIVRFQAQAITEIFPASGPVKTKIVGKKSRKLDKRAKRIEMDMNYHLTEKMSEYRPETEKLLFGLPMCGSGFRKIYFDPALNRPVSMYVPADDFIVNVGAADLRTASRFTHMLKRTKNEIRKQQVSGFYLDIELEQPSPTTTGIEEKKAKATGVDSTASIEADERHLLLEMSVEYDLPGFEDPDGIELPYVITIEKSSAKVLSIYRNWREDDETKTRRQYFVDYSFIPGMGFYGLGLIHLIGGLTASSTSILRQLVDAGTLANLQAGFKTRGLRIKGDDAPIMPGEWRDVDLPSGKLSENIMPLPYHEPSQVLHQLLLELVEEARRFVSLTDLKIGDGGQNAPVGTTLALLERSLKVMSGIQARLHASMKSEFKLLATIISDHGGDYDFQPESGEKGSREEDYGPEIDVIPVSDPNSSSMAQRIMTYQAAHQLSMTAPTIYDQVILHRNMLESLGIENVEEIIPGSKEQVPEDPVTENMNIITMKPIKAHWHQDHEAHIKVHLSAIEDPKIQKIVSKSPSAKAIMASAESHIREHVAFAYRRQIEEQMGVQLPPPGEPIEPEIENELSRLIVAASDQLLDKNNEEARSEEAMRKLQDPVAVAQERDSRTKESEVQRKAQQDQMANASKLKEIEQKREAKALEIGVKTAEMGLKAQASEDDRKSSEKMKAVDVAVRAVEKASDTFQQEEDRNVTRTDRSSSNGTKE